MADYLSNWQCPFCNQYASQAERFPISGAMTREGAGGFLALTGQFVLCPNPRCKKATIGVALYLGAKNEIGQIEKFGKPIQGWRLVPASTAKVFPDYVPEAIRNDYTEACTIKDLSPKASATLARRALQGMIRDFWGITNPRLAAEIEALKDKVDPKTWEAIDGVRQIGNIGAHMEKDVDTIIDVEPEEAEKLTWLIETLIQEWYIARFERDKRLTELHDMVTAKASMKSKEESKTK